MTFGETTDDNIIRRMRFSCWINKAADTLSEYVMLIACHGNIGYAKAPQFYVYTYILISTSNPRLPIPSGLLQSHFSTKTGNPFLVSSIYATCPAHLKLFVLTTLIMLVRSKSREALNYLSIIK